MSFDNIEPSPAVLSIVELMMPPDSLMDNV
jgi:hypothetical protein